MFYFIVHKKHLYVQDSKQTERQLFNHKQMRQQSLRLYCGSIFNAYPSVSGINNSNYTVQILGFISDLHIYDTCGQILRLVKSISNCLYFEYRFNCYKYMMLTNTIVVFKDLLFAPCSYVCNLSLFANFPSYSYSSNQCYALRSLCISPISFI